MKFIWGAVLLIVIAAAVSWLVKSQVQIGGPKPPSYVLERPMELIDEKTLEVMPKTIGAWRDLGKKDDKYKNPATGTYTMVEVTVCRSCGQKIPVRTLGLDVLPDQKPEPYICPRCGKSTSGGH